MNPAPPEPAPRTAWISILAAALLLTALNVAKPPHFDDAVYLIYADEFAAHPANPYDFEFVIPIEGSANNLLVPPVVPYWLALGTQVVGTEPTALRCWMFPFALLMAWAVDFFAARFSPSLRRPVLWLCVFSPGIVPSFSFTLDVPVLAVGFSALALAMLSLERESWRLALSAGIAAGVAMETKYNAAVSCAAILCWCCLRRRPLRGIAICAIGTALFVGWEYFVALHQGASHFLLQLQVRQGGGLRRMAHLVLPVVTQIAGLAVAPALLGFGALGRRTRVIVGVAVAMLIGIIVNAIFPSQAGLFLRANGKPSLTVATIVYALLAIPMWIAVVSVNARLIGRGRTAPAGEPRYDWFIPLWFVLEVAGCFLLSPTPAARRVFGMLAVFTLGAGRLAHLQQVSRRTAWNCAAYGAVVTLLFCCANLLDAQAGKKAVEQAIAEVAALEQSDDAAAVRKYGFDRTGWTGATYYFHRAGWLPMLPKEFYAPRPGDLIAVADVATSYVDGLPDRSELTVERIASVTVGDDFPLRLGLRYYSGGTPLENQQAGRMKVQVFRVVDTGDVARVSPPLQADRRANLPTTR